MTRVGIVASVDVRERLHAEALEGAVECVDLSDLVDDVAGIVVESDFLSLRLIASCDARAIPFVVLTQGSSESMLGAFGVDTSLPTGAPWSAILEVLSLPLPATRVAGALKAGPAEAAPPVDVETSETRAARLTVVWGPAGSPGRSVLALNLASEAVLMGYRVLLVDADTYGGSIAGYLELFDEAPGFLAASRLAAQGALSAAEIARLSHRVRIGDGEMTVLSGIVSSRRWPELTAARVSACSEELRNHFDLIVCDVGFNLEQDEEISSDITAPRRNQATLELLRHADQVVAVCSADVIGLARFIQSLEALKEAIQTTEVRWVVNRAKTSRGANASMVRQTLARFAGLTDVDVIDDDPKTVAAGVDLASPLCLVSPKSAVRVQMAAVAERCFALGGG